MVTIAEQVAALRRTLHRYLSRRLLVRTELPFLELRALRAISAKQAETQSQLANHLLVDAPAVSRLVDRLEVQELLKRTPGHDRRSVCLRVTAKALPLLAILEDELKSMEREVRKLLSPPEHKALAAALRKLDYGLREFSDGAGLGVKVPGSTRRASTASGRTKSKR